MLVLVLSAFAVPHFQNRTPRLWMPCHPFIEEIAQEVVMQAYDARMRRHPLKATDVKRIVIANLIDDRVRARQEARDLSSLAPVNFVRAIGLLRRICVIGANES